MQKLERAALQAAEVTVPFLTTLRLTRILNRPRGYCSNCVGLARIMAFTSATVDLGRAIIISEVIPNTAISTEVRVLAGIAFFLAGTIMTETSKRYPW